MAGSRAATREATTAVDTSREQLQAMAAAAIAEMQQTDEFDTEQMMLDIMEATSIDDILESQVVHLKDIIGTPFTVKSAQLQKSKYEEGFMPAYAVMRITFDDGSDAIVTTGATHVVATLIAATARKFFPFRASTVMLTTGSGNDVIKLVKAPE